MACLLYIIITVLFRQTWVRKRFHLLVGDRHDWVVEFDQKVGDGLIGEEGRHRRQQQVDEDEHDCENVLQAGFTEPHRQTALPDVVLCSGRRETETIRVKLWF